ncbi:MAG: penicillin-binding protein activator [Candidatus Latescibacteria bacterium]|nr:penicillin-binding protein activator [Candidatus Latescibacterota bacterium]
MRKYRLSKLSLTVFAAIMLISYVAYCSGEAFIPRVDALFVQGVESYKIGDFQAALDDFQGILQFPSNQLSSTAQLMVAKTLYKLGEYEGAIQAAQKLLETYPRTRYAPHAVYLIGGCRFRQGKYLDAVEEYAKVVGNKGDSRLKQRTQKIIDRIVETRLSPLQVEELQRRGLAKTYTPKAEPVSPALPAIGLLCPVSGPDSTFGQDLLAGAKLVLRDADNPSQLTLTIEDTKSSAIGAVKAIQRLAECTDLLAVVGPVFSLPTVAAAAVANCVKIPLIAPTANQDNLITIGKYIFQLNTTPRIQAERIAEYAVEDLDLKTLAVLAPLNSRGHQMSENFVQRTEELGGKVVLQEWYTTGTTDFGAQLQKVREAGLELLPPDSLESILAMEDTTETLVPLTNIEGFLVVGAPQEIALIAPQIVFWRIETQLLGGSGWNSPEVLQLGGDYVKGAIFVAEYFDENDSPTVRRFIDQFRQEYGRNPTKVATFGYDAVNLILRAWQEGIRTREQLCQALDRIWEFQGASGEISFRQRTNQSVFLLTIHGDRIVKIALLR